MKNAEFVEELAKTMRIVAPASFFRMSFQHPENRKTFFEILCNKACLNPRSLDVMRAFELAMKGGK